MFLLLLPFVLKERWVLNSMISNIQRGSQVYRASSFSLFFIIIYLLSHTHTHSSYTNHTTQPSFSKQPLLSSEGDLLHHAKQQSTTTTTTRKSQQPPGIPRKRKLSNSLRQRIALARLNSGAARLNSGKARLNSGDAR